MSEFNKYQELERLRELFKENTNVMQAIGHSSRQAILLAIMEGDFGGSRVGDIAKKAHLSNPAVSHHLKILKDASIVKMYSRGTMNYYYIDVSSKQLDGLINLATAIEKASTEFKKIQNYEEE